MAKNQKRKATVETTTSPAVSPRTPRSSAARGVTSAEFNPDYSYVLKDLKRIGILAVGFFAVLVVLSFFLK